jgi:hypothetical protein
MREKPKYEPKINDHVTIGHAFRSEDFHLYIVDAVDSENGRIRITRLEKSQFQIGVNMIVSDPITCHQADKLISAIYGALKGTFCDPDNFDINHITKESYWVDPRLNEIRPVGKTALSMKVE